MKKSSACFAMLAAMSLSTVAFSQTHAKDLEVNNGPGFSGELDFRAVSPGSVRGSGTIQYDNGVFTGVGSMPMIADNFSFGNRFSAQLPFTVTNLSIFMAVINSSTTGTNNAFVTVFGPLNTAGTNAAPQTSPSVPMSANTFNVVNLNVPFTGTGTGSFLAGVWNPTNGSTTAENPCGNDCVGFDNTSPPRGGFRGFAMEDLNGGNFTPIAANALMRATGPNLPVELMSFSIEE